MKRVLLVLIIMLTLGSAFAAMNLSVDTSEISGTLRYINSRPFIDFEGKTIRLLLAPKAVLDELEYDVAEGDTLAVEGILENNMILVSKVWNMSEGGKLFILRNFIMEEYYPGGATYKVDSKKCIACKLCIAPCPTGAISIVKGKAEIDPQKCTECGICIEGNGKFRGCPVGAIKP